MKLVKESINETIKHLTPRSEDELNMPEIVKKIINILKEKNIEYTIEIAGGGMHNGLFFIKTNKINITLSIDTKKFTWYGFYELNNGKETLIYHTKLQNEIFQYVKNYFK